MSISSSNYCPPGFDCAFINSCPSFHVDCLPGYFCSSFQGFDHQTKLDLRYALRSHDMEGGSFESKSVNYGNRLKFGDKDRAAQLLCLVGFYCPTPDTMISCPSGHWCPEGSLNPRACSSLSFCPAGSVIELNFNNPLIGGLMLLILMGFSFVVIRRQRNMNILSRKKLPASRSDTEELKSMKISESKSASDANSIEELVTLLDNDGGTNRSKKAVGRVRLEFRDLCFRYDENHAVLPCISGVIPEGKITVILGPTSCGKTSLLDNLKRGGEESHSGTVAATLIPELNDINSAFRFNNEELKTLIGMVPQQDVIDRDLTVRELLEFNAVTRVKELKHNDDLLKSRIDEILSDLAIQHIADSVIGGGENTSSNISGGQLKRVNIASELIALEKPSVLLLDEPTSGLDAKIAFDLFKNLSRIAKNGVTICAVLQQPRSEIFELVDHFILMDANGHIVFEGSPSAAAGYLKSTGFECFNEYHIADHCLDVVNGLVSTTLDGSGIHMLPDYWQKHCKIMKLHTQEIPPMRDELDSGNDDSSVGSTKDLNKPKWFRDWRKFISLCFLQAKRYIIVRLRDRNTLIFNTLLSLCSGFVISLTFSIAIPSSNFTYRPPSFDELKPFYPDQTNADRIATDVVFFQLMFFMPLLVAIVASLSCLEVLNGKGPIMQREQNVGLSAVAFAIGRISADTIFLIVYATLFTSLFSMHGIPGASWKWLLLCVGLAFASSGLSYIICTIISNPASASTYVVLMSVICCVFSGIQPSLEQLEEFYVLNLPWYISYGSWAAQGIYTIWVSYLEDGNNPVPPYQAAADTIGYDVSHGIGKSVGMLFFFGVVFRIIAVVIVANTYGTVSRPLSCKSC